MSVESIESPGPPVGSAPTAAVPAAAATATEGTEDALGAPREGSLRSNRAFMLVLLGQAVSALGDAVTFTALPLLVLALTGSGVQMGIVGALGRLPDLLFGLPAGVLADRMDRRRLMIIADAARAILIALIPLSAMAGLPTMGVVLLVTFPINIFRVLFMAGWTGAIPSIVSRRQLGPAVSAVEALVSLSYVIGPAVAGILVGVVGASETLVINAASFAFSAITLTWIRRPFQGERQARRAGFVEEMREGVAFITTHPVLRLAVAIWTAVGIVLAGLFVALTYAVTIDRGMNAVDLGFILAFYGIGNLVGVLVAGRMTRGRLAPQLLGGYLVQGLAIVVVGLPVTLPLGALLVAAVVGGVGSGLTVVAYLTYRASATPDRLMSRVGSTARTISMGLQPLGLFAAGVLLDTIGGNLTILVMGGANVLLAVLFALSPALRAAPGLEPRP